MVLEGCSRLGTLPLQRDPLSLSQANVPRPSSCEAACPCNGPQLSGSSSKPKRKTCWAVDVALFRVSSGVFTRAILSVCTEERKVAISPGASHHLKLAPEVSRRKRRPAFEPLVQVGPSESSWEPTYKYYTHRFFAGFYKAPAFGHLQPYTSLTNRGLRLGLERHGRGRWLALGPRRPPSFLSVPQVSQGCARAELLLSPAPRFELDITLNL